MGEVTAVLASRGIRLRGQWLPADTRAYKCWVQNRPGIQLAFDGHAGPVDVVLVPGRHGVQRQPLGDGGLQGCLIPCTSGVIVVLGCAGEELDQLEFQLRRAIGW